MGATVVSNGDVVIAANEPSYPPSAATDDTVGDVVLRTSGVERGRLRSDGALRFVSAVDVPQHQVPSNITPAGTRTFELDPSGNVLIGANTFVPSRTGTDNFYAPNFFYAVDKRTLYLNALKIAQISDPPDLVLGRTGPTVGGFETTPTGVLAGNCLGQIHYMGWVTPQGGTPGVTIGGGWNGASVRLQAYATEDFIRVAGNWQQGGELRIQTTPKLSATPVDRVAVRDDGVIDILTGPVQFAEIADPVAGAADTGRLYLRDNGAGKSQLCVRFNTGAVQVIATQP